MNSIRLEQALPRRRIQPDFGFFQKNNEPGVQNLQLSMVTGPLNQLARLPESSNLLTLSPAIRFQPTPSPAVVEKVGKRRTGGSHQQKVEGVSARDCRSSLNQDLGEWSTHLRVR